jgi:hypothetical protein
MRIYFDCVIHHLVSLQNIYHVLQIWSFLLHVSFCSFIIIVPLWKRSKIYIHTICFILESNPFSYLTTTIRIVILWLLASKVFLVLVIIIQVVCYSFQHESTISYNTCVAFCNTSYLTIVIMCNQTNRNHKWS